MAGGWASAQNNSKWRPGGGGHGQRPVPSRPAYRPDNHYRPRHDGGNGGAIVAAGIVGLALGAAIASANRYDPPPQPIPYADVDPYTQPYTGNDWHSYCAAKFSTYDPRDGRYLAADGRRYPCH